MGPWCARLETNCLPKPEPEPEPKLRIAALAPAPFYQRLGLVAYCCLIGGDTLGLDCLYGDLIKADTLGSDWLC